MAHNAVATKACTRYHEIWRLYVVFLHDWRVVVFPVDNTSSMSSEPFAEIVQQIILATFALGV